MRGLHNPRIIDPNHIIYDLGLAQEDPGGNVPSSARGVGVGACQRRCRGGGGDAGPAVGVGVGAGIGVGGRCRRRNHIGAQHVIRQRRSAHRVHLHSSFPQRKFSLAVATNYTDLPSVRQRGVIE